MKTRYVLLLKMESKQFQFILKEHLSDNASTTSRYVVSVFLTLLTTLGTVGNATVLWVFWARRQQVVATLFIVVLAAVDFSTCLVVMPFTVFMELKHFHVQLDAVCKLYQVFFYSLCYFYTAIIYTFICLFMRLYFCSNIWFTAWVKKTCSSILRHNFGTFWPIFKILSLLNSSRNLLFYCLVKCKRQKIAKTAK